MSSRRGAANDITHAFSSPWRSWCQKPLDLIVRAYEGSCVLSGPEPPLHGKRWREDVARPATSYSYTAPLSIGVAPPLPTEGQDLPLCGEHSSSNKCFPILHQSI